MLIFTSTKPWEGHTADIQYNAIQSWLRLSGENRIVVFGNAAGTASAAAEIGIEHIPDVALSNSGVPLVGPLFGEALAILQGNLIAYVNSDIMLLDSFVRAADAVSSVFPAAFLMIGQRHDTDIVGRLEFSDGWQSRLLDVVNAGGKLHGPTGIDYFVFTPRTFDYIPPFILGRTIWDNWLVMRALVRGVPVIDASVPVLAVHQNHDYSCAGGHGEVWGGADAMMNLHLAGNERADCRHARLRLTDTLRIAPQSTTPS